MKDEKLLKKMSKLLEKFGVDEEKTEKVLLALNEEEDDLPEEGGEEPKEEIKEEVAEEGEKLEEEPKEEIKEKPTEEPQEPENPIAKEMEKEDVEKVIEGLTARLSALEDLIAKLGTPANENFGESPTNESAKAEESSFDRYSKLRTGK